MASRRLYAGEQPHLWFRPGRKPQGFSRISSTHRIPPELVSWLRGLFYPTLCNTFVLYKQLTMTPEERKDAVLGYLNKKAALAWATAQSYQNIVEDCMNTGQAKRAQIAFNAWERSMGKRDSANKLIPLIEECSPHLLVDAATAIDISDDAELMYMQALAYAEAQ